ncbi:MAG: FAD-binding oxidoreductase [Thermodesulfobacteriota bacterium]
METGVRTAKGVVGYDFTRLFTGSEGTLGIITKIIVRLIANPKSRGTFLALFTSMDKATSLIAGLLKKITPAALEFLDRTALEIVKDKLPFALPEKTGSLLLLEVDGDSAMVEHQAAVMRKTLATGEGLLEVKEAKNEEEAAELWSARKALSPSSFILKPDKMSEDVVVPRTKIADLIRSAKKLSRKYGIIIFTFGHAGDGNIHINIMLDKKNENEYRQALDAKEKLFSEVLRLGGTLSGEHGVGITKMAFLDREISGVGIDMMKTSKNFYE